METAVIYSRSRLVAGFVYSLLTVIGIFVLFPFLWMLLTSLKQETEALRVPATWLPQAPTVEAYVTMWLRKNYARYFLNSTIVALSTAVISTFLGAMAAYGFSRFRLRGRAWLMGFILTTQMLPGVLLVGPYFQILSSVGLYDTRTGLIVAFLTICLPFATWMLKGFIDGIPVELDEAAIVDGAGRFEVFARIVVPLIRPGMVATTLFAFLLAWGDLLWVQTLTNSEAMVTVTLAIARTVQEFYVKWPELMAGALMGGLPGIVLYLVMQRWLVQGLTAGAIKQ
ncbi:MAG: carbohydrate ABC transporter permease [Armatimonadetes bacterium]|nr:carbohydrate ABC transporter permease [Armatimonadota bacterium]MBI2972533.1 carbohydrate ABC transporter permease [Armatimonadota bacterium]